MSWVVVHSFFMEQESPTPSTTVTQNLNTEKTSYPDDNPTRSDDGFETSSEKFNIQKSINEVLDHIQNVLANQENLCGHTTGFQKLDRMIGGLRPGEMFVIAGRPSMGTTSLMLNIVEHICIDQKVPTLIFSGNLSAFEMVQRILFSRAKFVMHTFRLRDSSPTKDDLIRIKKAAIEISNSNLFVDDTKGLSIETMRDTAHRFKQDNQIGFIAIDQLQHIKSDTPQARISHEREVSDVSSSIKSMAKELGVPVLVIAQLNRKPDSRSGNIFGIPRMSDLRDSGSIENDADIIGLLHRPAYYAETEEQKIEVAGCANLVIVKNHNGDTGWIPLIFIAELMRFESDDCNFNANCLNCFDSFQNN